MNEASIVIMMIIAGALWAVMSYAVGFKEGQRQGYTRGRAVSRHISHAKKTWMESDFNKDKVNN
jgi:hypothetical protein